ISWSRRSPFPSRHLVAVPLPLRRAASTSDISRVSEGYLRIRGGQDPMDRRRRARFISRHTRSLLRVSLPEGVHPSVPARRRVRLSPHGIGPSCDGRHLRSLGANEGDPLL